MLVACAATEGFLAPASAMLHSLVLAAGSEAVEIVLMHDEALSPEGRARVHETVAAAGGTLRFVAFPGALLDEFPSGHFPRSIWSRVLLPELLPEEDKVLYLDADTIVLESPAPLWRTELGDAYFAAVASPLYRWMGGWPRAVLGIDAPRRYVNSGVLLMNLALMREEQCHVRLLHYARAHPDNIYPDQDALSALFSDRHLSLHPRWNAQITLWDVPLDELPFSSEEVHEARARPAIVHFIGPFKPWHYLCTHPYRDVYFEHLAATPWPPPQLEGRTMVNGVLRHLSPVWTNRWFRARQAFADSSLYRRVSASGLDRARRRGARGSPERP
jgi:lipopolysaccharide biosynthesis glycosyltransferase